MRGHVVAAGTLAVLAHLHALAAAKPKVAIETDPPGATVYLDSTETSPVCEKTPCTIEMPGTETAVYIQLKGYQVAIESLDPANKKQKTLKAKLEPAVGAIVIAGKGAHVSIDDEDKGKAPDRYEVAEGAHHVVVTDAAGKQLFEGFIEVTSGEDAPVDLANKPDGGGDDNPIDARDDTDGGKVVKPNPAPPHGRYLVASIASDIGFRSFKYAGNATPGTLRDVDEAGEMLVGPRIEIWPLELAKTSKGRGLSLTAALEFHLNHQSVDNKDTTSLTTYWQKLEVLARYRYVAAGVVAIEPLAGYGSDTYRFSGKETEIALVPDAQYQSVRIGAKVSAVGLAGGKIEPYLEAENRIVVSAGAIGGRFTGGASTSGLHGALGVGVHLGAVQARLEGAITRYSWDFTSTAPMTDTYVATGATDSIEQVAIDIGYQY